MSEKFKTTASLEEDALFGRYSAPLITEGGEPPVFVSGSLPPGAYRVVDNCNESRSVVETGLGEAYAALLGLRDLEAARRSRILADMQPNMAPMG